MKCKAECPNTDVCEHGYCPPHRYSYCERKLTPTPMNDTQPTGLDLDTIFNKAFGWAVRQEVDGMEESIEEAKQALTRWGLEQRIDELRHVRDKLTADTPTFINIQDRIAELQANLQGEQS